MCPVVSSKFILQNLSLCICKRNHFEGSFGYFFFLFWFPLMLFISLQNFLPCYLCLLNGYLSNTNTKTKMYAVSVNQEVTIKQMVLEIIFQNTDVISNKTSSHSFSSHALMIESFRVSKRLKHQFHFNSKTWPKF